MKIAWICDTQYQLLNFSNYMLTCRNADDEVDVYIGHQFVNSRTIQEKIEKENLCKKTYSFYPSMNQDLQARIHYLISDPCIQIKEMLDTAENFTEINYDIVFISFITRFSMAFNLATRPNHVYFFEDGTASYYGNFARTSWKRALFSLLLGRNVYEIRPDALYVNNPALCRSTMTKDIRALPPLKNDNLKKWSCIQRIFDYKGGADYQTHSIVFLTQPNNTQIHVENTVDPNIINRLYPYSEEIIIRPHPRPNDAEVQRYSRYFFLDTEMDMWELICADQITDKHILVGAFSTAQLTPKMLFNKEPYLLFLYELYPNLINRKRKKEVQKLIKMISQSYSDSSKILIVKNYNDISAFINAALKRK